MNDVYLDNAATTPLDPRVREAMLAHFGPGCGNPSSLHRPGRLARAAVEDARRNVAGLFSARPEEIVFTGSGTEANNLAILGAMTEGHLVVSSIEHPSVLQVARSLERRGLAVTFLPVEPDGLVAPPSLAAAIRPDTRLVSIMAANNVIGTVQPLEVLSQVAHDGGALFHTDAVQAAGKIPLDVTRLGVDLLSLSAHKLYGPQGVGALFVRAEVSLAPMLFGGGQERGLRPATENVAGVVGLGKAAELARREMVADAVRLVALRDRIVDTLSSELPNAYLIGDRYRRLPGHICMGLAGQEVEAIRLLLELDARGVAVSSGSACSAGSGNEPSHVLRAMGRDPIAARGSIRITLGRFTSTADVDHLLRVFPEVARALRPQASR